MRLVILLLLLSGPANDAVAAWRLVQEDESRHDNAALRVITKTARDARTIRLHVVLPDPDQTRLAVFDNPENARWLDESMAGRDCLAGVNGGYFHPDTTPIGLVVSEGDTLHAYERARLLSGVMAVSQKSPALLRVTEYSNDIAISQGLQAGPFIIDHGRPVKGLEATKRARRTVIFVDEAGRYGLAMSDSVLTLAELATLLASPGIIHELRISRALNLDGGSSSAIWARTGDRVLYRREVKRVRNFLCVLADAGKEPHDLEKRLSSGNPGDSPD